MRLQEAYVRKVIDTVNDMDNVLYEICNECSANSIEWQYHMVNYVKSYEASKPKQHPVGMSALAECQAGTMKALLASPADWVAPCNDYTGTGHVPTYSYDSNPPATQGEKVIVSDTDHFFGVGGDHTWVWKTFTRGLNPVYMDPYGDPKFPVADNSARLAMGQTLRFANRLNLATMTPRSDLCSTTYCLANPGIEYLVYVPAGQKPTVSLSGTTGQLNLEWFNPATGAVSTGQITAQGTSQSFTAPFSGDAVLYLYSLTAANNLTDFHRH